MCSIWNRYVQKRLLSDFLDYILKGSISGTNEQCVHTNKAIFRLHVNIPKVRYSDMGNKAE